MERCGCGGGSVWYTREVYMRLVNEHGVRAAFTSFTTRTTFIQVTVDSIDSLQCEIIT